MESALHLQRTVRTGLIVCLLFSATSLLAAEKPDWVDGAGAHYPDATYLTGVGSGDTRQKAEDSAYAALARIFRTEVRSTVQEREDFKQAEKTQGVEVDRRVDIQNQTVVSTDKVLEQVRIAERWADPVSQVYYALAVLDRAKSAAALRQQSLDAETEAREWESRAKRATDPMEQARALRKAILAARRTESYEADLRVVQPTGRGEGLNVNPALLDAQLRELLSRAFRVDVHIEGPYGAPVRDALLAKLHEKGLTGAPDGEILIQGEVGMEPVDLNDPRWHYARWTAHVTLTQKEGQKIFGGLQRSGREGHLSAKEADRKALSAMQKELSESVGETLLNFIYGN
ncbi:MAG: LPP20 family lipoprotein [Nitrospirae bacterium]|nr:LPP20 family lipoprotein [Candidatus Manganitrophaceae bacterium]